jgi:hypothetical protein
MHNRACGPVVNRFNTSFESKRRKIIMSIEQVIRAWKADEDDQNSNATANPVGEELTDQELLAVIGGRACCESAGANGSAGPGAGTCEFTYGP